VTPTIGIEPDWSEKIAMNENQQTHAAELERQQLTAVPLFDDRLTRSNETSTGH